jgi:hypothetical protein
MATQIIGTLAVNNLLPIQARNAGSVPFGPISIPAGYTSFSVMFDLQQITSLTATLSAIVEISFDAGATWQTVGDYALSLAQSGYRLIGGVLTRALDDPLGNGPVRYFGSSARLAQTESTTRQVRGTLTSTEALISGVTLVGV